MMCRKIASAEALDGAVFIPNESCISEITNNGVKALKPGVYLVPRRGLGTKFKINFYLVKNQHYTDILSKKWITEVDHFSLSQL